MAGTMNDFCTRIREEATELLLLGGSLPAPLARHVASCSGCAEEAEGVRRVVRTFERADSAPVPAALPVTGPTPSGGSWRYPGRARRRVLSGVVTLMLAACAAFVTVVTAVDHGSHTSTAAVHVAQDGEMVPHSWGTEIPVALSGLRAGSTYRFMTGNAHGERVQAGSMQSSAQSDTSMHVRLTTAMHKDTITTLYVQDADGHFVAQARVGPHRTT
ncbi:hypothetical protein QFZ63_000073 [Streptomyces sp. B3I7]|uniref:hypothetical protein n=1 Tax=Streptomyces sp. B3I7 TaxID=3042269 RepID=UPI00277E6302|nr:hypothetical protein [Streptomyces sp. B3I7]MDQ0808359.1 hypothetical protein [Streptomyces sp. B3I7]